VEKLPLRPATIESLEQEIATLKQLIFERDSEANDESNLCRLYYPMLPDPESIADGEFDRFDRLAGELLEREPALVKEARRLFDRKNPLPPDLELYRPLGAAELTKYHDPFSIIAGTDVADIDDSSVPREIAERIRHPADGRMREAANKVGGITPIIVLPIDFDVFPRNPAVTKAALRSFLFGSLGSQALSTYFAASSYGHLAFVEGHISDVVRLPSDLSKPDDPHSLSGSDTLVQKACEGSTVDWNRFASADGLVSQEQATLVVLAPFGNRAGAARYHKFSFEFRGRKITIDGHIAFWDYKKDYAPDASIEPLAFARSVAIHELNHVLFGLPDRYETDPGRGRMFDYVGGYDIMSNAGAVIMLNPHDRMKMGFIEPRILHLGHVPRRVYKLRSAEGYSNSCVVVYSDLSPNEYWIIENRWLGDDIWGADRGFPESGLCIWWVDMNTEVVVLLNRNHASDKPLSAPQPGARPFDSALGQRDAILFPQNGTGFLLLRKISMAGSVMTFEL
jgi:M6 family metalloprotease-like protein